MNIKLRTNNVCMVIYIMMLKISIVTRYIGFEGNGGETRDWRYNSYSYI